MKNLNKIILAIITISILLFSIGFLLKIISANIAFPMIFILLGGQQVFNGLFIFTKNKKPIRLVFIVFGSLLIIFGIFIVFPSYYS